MSTEAEKTDIMNGYVMEGGKPMPTRGTAHKWYALLLNANVGDSILLSVVEARSFINYAKRLGIATIYRTTREHPVKTVRVWVYDKPAALQMDHADQSPVLF